MRFDVHPFKTVDEAREWAKIEIDARAGKARARYLTITEGQEATYTAKYLDAKAYLTAGPNADIEQYPWIKGEALRTNLTYEAAALGLKEKGDYWNSVVGPKIEDLRLGGKEALPGLTGIAQIVAHTRVVQRELDLI